MRNEHLNITRTFIGLLMVVIVSGCEKEITVEVPDSEARLVIEGRIESDGVKKIPPIVTLTKTTGYFSSTSISELANLQVHNAQVSVTVDNTTYPLEEVCTATIDTSLLPLVADFLGVPEEELAAYNYCVYTVPLADLVSCNFLSGEVGKTYHLTVVSEGATYTAKTKIPSLNKLNSVWFEAVQADTFGYAWANMSDPDTVGNGYRWFAQRLSRNAAGEQKDATFLAPAGSAFEDKFINGITFDFAYDRGHRPGEHAEDDPAELPHFFKKSDTILVKFCTIDMKVYRFLRIYEIEVNSAGSPFASPSTIPTNIEGGGLGLWAGYGVTYDTIFGVD